MGKMWKDHETLRLIPKCDHVFHPDCIDAWLGSHTTCPVCRANLVPQPGESLHLPAELNNTTEGLDVEAQNDAVLEQQQPLNKPEELQREQEEQGPEELNVKQTLNRNRTRNSRSGRARWLPFPRSNSTGHSVVPPGENTEQFTLRLPVEVRKQLMNRHLSRATSMVLLPREGSSRRGYRTGTGWEGGSG
jgi:E3 ubiquitin-protein ligase ATL6/9/15/31/42/55